MITNGPWPVARPVCTIFPNLQMVLCSISLNLAGASQANGAILRLLRTPFDGNELCFKCFRGLLVGLRARPEGPVKPFTHQMELYHI